MENVTNDDSRIRFSLDTNGIEAKALAKILQETHYSFREISKENELKEAEIKIYPFKQGSFEYMVSAVVLGTSVVALGTSVISLFEKIIDYKKAKLELKNDRKNDYGQDSLLPARVPVVVNNNIDIHVNELLKAVSEHSSGFSLKHPTEEKEIVGLTSDQIKRILKIEKSEQKKDASEQRTIDRENQTVFLVKTSQTRYGKWTFIYDGIRIAASVPDFIKASNHLVGMKPGTMLTVKLRIKQKFNAPAKVWENMNYQIIGINSTYVK